MSIEVSIWEPELRAKYAQALKKAVDLKFPFGYFQVMSLEMRVQESFCVSGCMNDKCDPDGIEGCSCNNWNSLIKEKVRNGYLPVAYYWGFANPVIYWSNGIQSLRQNWSHGR